MKSDIKIRKGQVDWPSVWGTPSSNGQVLTGTTTGDYTWVNADTTGGQDKNFVHEQINASAIWTITHSLDKYPSVTVFDSAGTQVEGEVIYKANETDSVLSKTQLIIKFEGSFSGTATLN